MSDLETRRELTVQADRILKVDKKLSSGSAGNNIDLLTARDASRRSARQANLAVRNHHIITEMSIASDFRITPEDHLLEEERQQELEKAIEDLFAWFESDATASEILIQVLTYSEPYRDSKRLAALLEVRVEDIRAAKERIRYYVKNNLKSPF